MKSFLLADQNVHMRKEQGTAVRCVETEAAHDAREQPLHVG